jgi:riboflavin kinase/FMN adenylyltransferase
MLLITENTIKPLSNGSVVTIGNFDGVHLGHQKLIETCADLSHADLDAGDLDVVVVTFDPTPRDYFSPSTAPVKLSSAKQKTELLEQSGVDLVWMMRFNQQLAEMSARNFAKNVINRALLAKHVVVGEDFRFGYQREGDVDLLNHLGDQFGFRALSVADLDVAGLKVSSTLVRRALAQGKFDRAEEYLGRRFTTKGKVIEGRKLGRKLGYPTANMKPEAEPCPIAGVFAVRARQLDSTQWLNGVASLGTRPAVGGQEFLIEVHLFDCSPDLYGQTLEVDYVAKIRDEENFNSTEGLIAGMNKDEKKAREILN